MTFEYQLPRELESFARGEPRELMHVLVQESTLLCTYPHPGTDADTPPSRRKIWHYSLSDRGYTWFSLREPNIIVTLEYWDARIEHRKTLYTL